METKHPKSLDELKSLILTQEKILLASAQTSTVIPWSQLQKLAPQYFEDGKYPSIVSLQSLPSKMELRSIEAENDSIYIEGPVSWREAEQFARSHGRRMMTMPTEDLASVLAGLATSCTGEHAFGYGTTRDQVVSLSYMNDLGEVNLLEASKSLKSILPVGFNFEALSEFQNFYQLNYKNFKNAPFQRLNKATDLLVGSEGHFGPILSATLETTKAESVSHLFIPLKHKWYEDFSSHLKLFQWGQKFRGKILAFEFLDCDSLKFASKIDVGESLNNNQDYLFFEVLENSVEELFESLSTNAIDFEIDVDQIFNMESAKFQLLRKSIPRAVAEHVDRLKIIKQGTDVQVSPDLFGKLLEQYKIFKNKNIESILFGHFGDAHLHYNFFPKNSWEANKVQIELEELYSALPKWGSVSPFAEHGVGMIKKKYIANFNSSLNEGIITILKNRYAKNKLFF
ncbi:MAG: FAD-linked oxidase C-terminal domain-containing protein [Bacteriovoracaceae bacterium]|nr:FAD-linked oxidase C-terminal domain-containing protein [Bacteriovoracaceae bacterium]